MSRALIGFSGFVGTTLRKQLQFDELYRSTNISQIEGKSFDQVFCAGAPAQKWIANREPEKDRENIEKLISHISKVKCKTFILLSTVDVFSFPTGVDERSAVHEDGLHAYGRNRRRLEVFVEENFESYLILRLPGLVGPGLKKNVIFDFLNQNNLNAIDSRGTFQFYPMVNLSFDVEKALTNRLKLVHLAAEPVSVADISERGFGKKFENVLPGSPARYDMRSIYSKLWGSDGPYPYTAKDTIQAVRSYAQSESSSLSPDAKGN